MVHLDGHELAILGTISGAYGVASATLGKGWVKSLIHRHPIPAMSIALSAFGIALPLVIVPVRRAIGMPTNQYDATHPRVSFPKFVDQ